MSNVQRSSDLKEGFAQKAIMSGIGALVCLSLAGVLFAYQSASMMGLLIVAAIAGIGLLVYFFIQLGKTRQIPSVLVQCPYCKGKNFFTGQPQEEVRCDNCQRMMPIWEGRMLSVFEVRCGYCNTLNWYNEHSVGLICESCNREIPISTSDSNQKTFFKPYVTQDDDGTYDLVLTRVEHHNEDIISTLQHMLALNRNQVKDILDNLPATLLTGIPKRKAEMLRAQLAIHDAEADMPKHQ